MKKGIIFDMDGTMFDTESIYHKGWERVAHLYGQVFQPEFQIAACGTTGQKMLDTVYEYYPEVDAKSFVKDCSKWVEEQVKIQLPEKPGLHEILHYVKEKGLKMAVASGSRMKIIEHNLKKAGIENYFDALASGHEVENGKPAPDVFLLAASRLGLKPEECYVIEEKPDEELKERCLGVFDSLLDVKEFFEQGEFL